MRRILAVLLLSAMPAFADDTTTSGLIAEQGLAATMAELESAPVSADRNMALAAVRFLAGIEKAYQERWRIGATSSIFPAPVLGTELEPPNPSPEPMQPDFLNRIADEIVNAMRSTRDVLPEAEGALVLRLPDLWLDVDGSGDRGPSEGLLELVMIPMPEGVDGEVRFDAADSEWLRAYTHLIEAVCTLLLAFDPEPALAQNIELAEALHQQFSTPSGDGAGEYMPTDAMELGPIVDMIAVVIYTLRNQPEKAKIEEAQQHLVRMIEANRNFWAKAAEETDNSREWIPNDNQQAALGFDIPKGAGRAWLAVLDDAELVLRGERLIPFWRFAPGYGIDLQKWIDDPKPVDLVSWIQGSAALPYTRPGEMVDRGSWEDFTEMFSGRAGLYMVLFN